MRRSDYLALREEILRYPRVAHEDRHFGLVAQAAGLRGRYDDSLVVHHRVTRGWHGLLRESLRQGQGDGALHALHPQLGPVDVDEPLEGANPLVKAIVRRTDRDGPRRAVLGSLHGLTTAADRLRLTRTAERAAFAATLVARRQGASGRAGAPPHPQGAGAHGPAGGDG